MTAASPEPHPLRLAGRWVYGFEGHHVYLVRGDEADLVKLGTTMDLTGHLAGLQKASPTRLQYAAVLPGKAAHKAHIARMFAAHRRRGDWYEAGPLLTFARDACQRLEEVDARDGREALLIVLAGMDPAITDLKRMWRNGTSAANIAGMTGLSLTQVDTRVKQLRAMGFDLSYRYVSRFRVD